ncbi:MAG: hypothetical protein ACR2OO_13260 [Thermomicrobiales bacterium]
MMDLANDLTDLTPILTTIKQTADRLGLVVLSGTPYGPITESGLSCDGDWQTFLDVAVRAGVAILNVDARPYDPDAFTLYSKTFVKLPDWEDDAPLRLQDAQEAVGKNVRHAIRKWDRHAKSLGQIHLMWLHAGVAHDWERQTSWMDDCEDKTLDVVSEALEGYLEEPIVPKAQPKPSEQEIAISKRIHELAIDLARHPRFTDAASDQKRQFMAEQLYGNQLPELEGSNRPAAYRIAERAVLAYWWAIGPEEQLKLTERALDLATSGEPKRRIAAILRISEARVEQLLAAAKRPAT